MITKRNTLIVSAIITVAILAINYIGTYQTCGFDRNCAQLLANIIRTLFIFFPIFILSLITYKMRDTIFQSWLKFAYFWVLLTIILTILAPEYDSSFVSLTKGLVSFTLSAIFLLISLIIIIIKSFSSKKGQ